MLFLRSRFGGVLDYRGRSGLAGGLNFNRRLRHRRGRAVLFGPPAGGFLLRSAGDVLADHERDVVVE